LTNLHPGKQLHEIIPLLTTDSIRSVRYSLLNSTTVSNLIKDTISSDIAKVASHKYVGRDLNSIVNELKGRGYSDDAANRIANKIENINHSSGTAGNTAGNATQVLTQEKIYSMMRDGKIKYPSLFEKGFFGLKYEEDLISISKQLNSEFNGKPLSECIDIMNKRLNEVNEAIRNNPKITPEYQNILKNTITKILNTLNPIKKNIKGEVNWGKTFIAGSIEWFIGQAIYNSIKTGSPIGGAFQTAKSEFQKAKTGYDTSPTNQSSNSSQVTMDQFNQFLTSHNVNPSRYKITQNGNVFTLNDKNNSSFIYDNGTFKKQ